ncbi:hypothetical protein BASA60_006002 [Batrachochytrium salamandrivorans]|nr:hypothetical protein BASA60_006002 [Batrachochytrium salamandrivorans]
MGLLWKRNNGDDEQGPSPMDSDTGASAGAEAGAETSDSSDDSIPNHPSSSGGLSELDQTPDPTEEPPLVFPRNNYLFKGRNTFWIVTKNLSKKSLKT